NGATYDESGKVIWTEGGAGYSNPLGLLLQSFSAVTKHLNCTGGLDYQFTPQLSLNVTGGYTSTQLKETSQHPKDSYSPTLSRTSGDARFGINSFESWILEPQLTYVVGIGEGTLNTLVGVSWQQELADGQVIHASDYSSEGLLNSTTGAATISTTNSFTQYRYQSVFARLNYNHREKYLLTLTGRRDGSSRFGPRNQYANFGAIGTAWIFSEEPIINKLSFLSFGKIRGSYGVTGNDNIGDYQYLDI